MEESAGRDVELLKEISRVLRDRLTALDQHEHKLKQVADFRQKVRLQLEKIDEGWDRLLDEEKKECETLTLEREAIEGRMRSESLTGGGSKESLGRSQLDLSTKGTTTKPPPSRVGNYSIMAKRLQSEIKSTEQQVQDMKSRLNVELENKINLETKVRELRSGLALQKRAGELSQPGGAVSSAIPTPTPSI